MIIARLAVKLAMFFKYERVQALKPSAPCAFFDAHAECPRIAVQVHLFYTQLTDEIIRHTNLIPYRFDCFISTDTLEKAEAIRRAFQAHSRACRVTVDVFCNRGRDMMPFVLQMTAHAARYDYLCHIHTKHSPHSAFGDRWRKYLLKSLLPDADTLAALLRLFETDARLGLVFQRTYWRVKPAAEWAGNYAVSQALLARLGLPSPPVKTPPFPAGNMFWARTAALAPVFACALTETDFEPEQGQRDATLAHALERCWALITQAGGYTFTRV